jgi:hypothetical protein
MKLPLPVFEDTLYLKWEPAWEQYDFSININCYLYNWAEERPYAFYSILYNNYI